MLFLVRHGESAWNAADRFAGWADVALTEVGREQARNVGRRLLDDGCVPTVAHTSVLTRAVSTADLILDACGAATVPRVRTPLLNERHYGALQGLPRTAAVERFGAAQVARWRRGVFDRPPADAAGHGESLADVRARIRPYVETVLFPVLDAGDSVLLVSHGNTLRMLRQIAEGLTDAQASALELPTGGYVRYEDVSGLRRAC